MLYKLGIMVGIGDEGIIFLVIVRQVDREEMSSPVFGEQPDGNVFLVIIAEDYHTHDADDDNKDDNEG